ncbi:uncharacterized protein LOC113491154 isoform X2 [Athene cunicularia]|uniref:uncharacterized protein LOC113491154 isoform X2 n=1 Tax=Athene cunicularia TaxID=194338 RepID=UPI000EF69296|nr:uncharacterized protein LOC113491154 isoform X2 [Athene cunicularia]
MRDPRHTCLCPIIKSHYRIITQVGRQIRRSPDPNPCSDEGQLGAASGCTGLCLDRCEHPQGWRLYNFPEHLVQCLTISMQHSHPGCINPSTAFFAHSRLMRFQKLQTQEASKLLEFEKAETPPLQEPHMAAGWPGSALQDQRCTHTESFFSPAVQCSSTQSVFPRGWDCWRAQQGGGRVLQAVLMKPSPSEHWKHSETNCLSVGGQLLEGMTAICVPWLW